MGAMLLQILLLALVLLYAEAFHGFPSSVRATGRMQNLVMRERKCDLAGTRKNSKAMNVSKSNAHTHRTQEVNLQSRKMWWEEGNKFVRIRVSARTLKTIKKNGLNATAKKFGINLDKFAMSGGTAPAPKLAPELADA